MVVRIHGHDPTWVDAKANAVTIYWRCASGAQKAGMQLPKLNSVEPPKDERPFGETTFNYASHDGRFTIGAEPWTFETRWSSASLGSAHLYNDPAGIEGAAIAEGVARISQVTPDVVAADFTSRTRTPGVGQVALLRNTAGFYAALVPSRSAIRVRH